MQSKLYNFEYGIAFVVHQVIGKIIPGVKVSDIVEQTNATSKQVTTAGPKRIKIFTGEDSKRYFRVEKYKKFESDEIKLIENIIRECNWQDILETDYWDKFVHVIVEMGISDFIGSNHSSQTVFDIIDIYSDWSSQTYEGNRISHSIGIDGGVDGGSIDFKDVSRFDFSKLLGSSKDTLLVLSSSGKINRIDELTDAKSNAKELFAPISMINIASWTSNDNRVAVSLTRNGEILLFKQQQLMFAKRRGYWSYFPHKMLIDYLTYGNVGDIDKKTRKALYCTSLDVAFTRSGGCIGLVGKMEELNGIVNGKDFLCAQDAKSKVSECISLLCKKKRVHQVPRAIRAEMCAIDGAFTVDSKGHLLAAGAILRIKKSDGEGGGRTAAAKTFGKLGVGIKISNDGYVDIYKKNEKNKLRFA